jgi:hypothetical protein
MVLTIGLIIVSAAACATAAVFAIQGEVREQVVNSQSASLRIAADIFHENYPELVVTRKGPEVERLVIPVIPEFPDHSMIDRVGGLTNETATVFVWDEESKDFWRRTTNIKKDDGSRAIGTPLGQNGAVYPVVTKGQTFRGEAVILGKAYYTIYAPIFSTEGKVIGILYAGVLKSNINAILDELTSKLAITSAVTILVTALIAFFAFRMLLRLAVFALAVTVALGITLATAIGYSLGLPLIEITHVHAAWGLGGWALILLMGVSYYVVPMFQLTPPYPLRLGWVLPPSLILILALWSWQAGGVVAPWQQTVFFAGILLAAIYAATTLILQSRRRRKVPDATLVFFRGAMICLLAIAASSLWFVYDTDFGSGSLAPIWLGILAIPGVFVSAISGMLYKIVPFLNWLHLQRIGGLGTPPPNMREMLSESAMFGQMRLHFGALALLLLSVPLPVLTRPAGLLFAVSCAWLGINLLGGVRSYRRLRDRILADAACRGS